MLKEALLYKTLAGNKVSCFLCSHHRLIADGKFGVCNVRENKGGVLYTHAHGELIAQNLDPIEKSLCIISFRAQGLFRLPPLGVIFYAGFAKIGRFLR